MNKRLPPGQRALAEFPTFGLTPFAERIPRQAGPIHIEIGGDVEHEITVTDELTSLPRVELEADFHCVTTWSYRSIRWSGFRFIDFYEQIVVPQVAPEHNATLVVFSCLDGATTALSLGDLLNTNVLLADRLEGQPLTLHHGAPLRVVAPAHYGYKNAKHVAAIRFWRDARHYRPAGYRFMDHPRARVDYEERGRWLPGWVYRYLYRPLVTPTIRTFRRAVMKHHADSR